jgi:hypothetical protein
VSRGSSFLVLAHEDEEAAFDGLTALLASGRRSGGTLVRVAPPHDDVWLGTGRNLGWDDLLVSMAALPWRHPGYVQVLVRDQDDAVYGLWVLRDGRFAEARQPGGGPS